MEKRFGGPEKVLEFFVSKRVGTLCVVTWLQLDVVSSTSQVIGWKDWVFGTVK